MKQCCPILKCAFASVLEQFRSLVVGFIYLFSNGKWLCVILTSISWTINSVERSTSKNFKQSTKKGRGITNERMSILKKCRDNGLDLLRMRYPQLMDIRFQSTMKICLEVINVTKAL